MTGRRQDEMPKDLRILRADNPGPLTGTGTNTYLLGRGDVVVIDPGPALQEHHRAILGALDPGERIAAVLVTHSHIDHTALARRLAREARAPLIGAGRAGSGRSALMDRLAANGLTGGGEGFDPDYAPDRVARGGERLAFGGLDIEVLQTPGHTGCHLAFAVGRALFAGDTVMGWATTVVSPPDGDMGAYLATLAGLAARDWQVIHPGHGPAIADPSARLADLIAHRRGREAAILSALTAAPATAATLAARVYTTTPPALMPAATRNVLAHLIDLTDRHLVTTAAALTPDSLFARA